METGKTAPSLLDLCIKTAIENRRHLSDVGDVDFEFLERILSHCCKEYLMRVEKNTKGRDMSPMTNKFWKRIFQQEFGSGDTEMVVRHMKQKGADSYRWLKFYEARLRSLEEAEAASGDKYRRLYEEDVARKKSQQVQICSKVDPSRRRRGYFGGGIKHISKVRRMFDSSGMPRRRIK